MKARSVSVILPVLNEEGAISSTLDALLGQDYEGDLEIHAVDGGSTDGTVEILETAASKFPNLSWSTNANGETPSSLNLAISRTTGEVIVRCDARSVFPSSYVSIAVALLDQVGAGNVGGLQVPVGKSILQRAIARAMTSPAGVGDARFRRGGEAGPVDTVYLGTFPRTVLEEVGGYNEAMVRNQDYELNIRIRKAGHQVFFSPELVIVYLPRSTVGGLASQYFQYGRWRRLGNRLHPGYLRWRQAIPPLLVVALMVSGALAIAGRPAIATVTPIVYGLFVIAASVLQLIRSGDRAAVLLVIVLPVMHLSWGAGFLIGPPR